MWKEFKEFISRGNVIDLAVGVIIGAAFGKIVSSLVTEIITPILGLIVGGVDFTKLGIVLRANPDATHNLVLSYGLFLQEVFNFFIIAAALFFIVKLVNTLRRKKEKDPAPPAPPPEDIALLREIRDLLKEKR